MPESQDHPGPGGLIALASAGPRTYSPDAQVGRTVAVLRDRGKSGLHGDTVPDNIRRGRPQGQCHRKRTARAPARARVKRCGKSAPRDRQRERQGKPHREQNRIGATRASCSGPSSAPSPGLVARGGRRRPSQRNDRPVRSDPCGQNPAYRPTGAPFRPSSALVQADAAARLHAFGKRGPKCKRSAHFLRSRNPESTES